MSPSSPFIFYSSFTLLSPSAFLCLSFYLTAPYANVCDYHVSVFSLPPHVPMSCSLVLSTYLHVLSFSLSLSIFSKPVYNYRQSSSLCIHMSTVVFLCLCLCLLLCPVSFLLLDSCSLSTSLYHISLHRLLRSLSLSLPSLSWVLPHLPQAQVSSPN